MKIECSKREWYTLHAILLNDNWGLREVYNNPDFECDIIDPDSEDGHDIFFSIKGSFVEDICGDEKDG